MGAGIIQVAAQSGIEVVGIERTEAGAEAARLRIEAGLEATAARGKISPEQAREAASRFIVTTELARVADADLVVEAGFDDRDLQKSILQAIERAEVGAEAARLRIEAGLEATAARGKISPEQAREAASRFSVTTELARVADADLVVEAVFEDVDLKKGILKEIDRLVGPDTFI